SARRPPSATPFPYTTLFRSGTDVAQRIVAERDARGEFRDMDDLARRVGLTTAQLESLATAGAFECFGLSTRQALWAAGAAAQNRSEEHTSELQSRENLVCRL